MTIRTEVQLESVYNDNPLEGVKRVGSRLIIFDIDEGRKLCRDIFEAQNDFCVVNHAAPLLMRLRNEGDVVILNPDDVHYLPKVRLKDTFVRTFLRMARTHT